LFREIISYLGYRIKEFLSSRLFPLGVAFLAMFVILVVHLYNLQIVNGEAAQTTYIEQKTLRTINLSSTRGNIYDRNGTLLAYNDLVFSVTIKDTGEYNGYQKNLIILKLLEILDKHSEKIVTSLPSPSINTAISNIRHRKARSMAYCGMFTAKSPIRKSLIPINVMKIFQPGVFMSCSMNDMESGKKERLLPPVPMRSAKQMHFV